MILNLKKYRKFNILIIISLCIIIYGISSFFGNVESLMISMIIIMVFLSYVIVCSHKKHNKLLKLAKNNKRKYNLAIDILDVVIWEWESETKELFISPKIKDILRNYTKELYTFKKLLSYISEDDKEPIKNFFYDLIQNNIIDNFILECSIINDIGEKIIIEIQGKSRMKGDVFFISGYFKDVTIKKHKENINTIDKFVVALL